MPDSTPSPDSPDVGDDVRFADELNMGDLCYFDRDWDGSWLVRRLDDVELWGFDRPLLRLTPGDAPNSGSLRLVSEAELHSLLDSDRS